jgi:hypothetical protein
MKIFSKTYYKITTSSHMAAFRSSLSDSFVYGSKPVAAPATKSKVYVFPENGSTEF